MYVVLNHSKLMFASVMNVSVALCNKRVTHTRKILKTNAAFMILCWCSPVGSC